MLFGSNFINSQDFSRCYADHQDILLKQPHSNHHLSKKQSFLQIQSSPFQQNKKKSKKIGKQHSIVLNMCLELKDQKKERQIHNRKWKYYIKYNMQVLEISQEGESSDAECANLLRLALQQQGFTRISINPFPNVQKETYYGTLLLPRAHSSVEVRWKVKVGAAGSACVEVGLAGGEVGTGLCGFLLEVGNEVQELTHLLNNLDLSDKEGYFIFKQLTGQLLLRYKITKTRYLPVSSRLRYLRRTLTTITSLFIQHLENIIFYYRLPGFSLNQLQESLQPTNNVPLKYKRDSIIYLQHYFQAQRWQRKGSSSEMVRFPYRPFQAYFSLLFTAAPEMRMQIVQLQQRIQGAEGMFKFQVQTLEKDLRQCKQRGSSQLILTAIKIKQRAKEVVIGSGGYAEIIYGVYSYIPQISIYGNSNQEESLMKSSLVKKKGLCTTEGDVNVSLKNQCNFLKYIRNKVCPYIAKYYCNSDVDPFSDGEILLQYYPRNLGECKLTEQRKMKVIEDVCMALLFLGEEKLIHRDLKEVNIMVDRYHRGRLIDFGSASNVNGSNKFKPSDEKLRSTIGYYIPYRQAVTNCPSVETQFSRLQYYSHETFDLFGLGQVLENEFYLGRFSGSNNFLRHSLLLLSRKCRQINPEDRWTVQQVTVFLRHLLIFNQQRRKFWRCGFEHRLGAHELGQSYNGAGEYQSWQKTLSRSSWGK